ncbi:type I secretion C-terminal target domain-containing protein [Geminicoccaceae bacterium 1502E]|nr:type I secretion C-terminal target domain-containing protein [Geminicoccaceae bacterium 1502E]
MTELADPLPVVPVTPVQGEAGQRLAEPPVERVVVTPPPDAGAQVEIHVRPGMEIVLLDEVFEPTQARYAVSGTDLVAVLPNGSRVTLVDFFAVANPPVSITLLDSPPVAATALLGEILASVDPAALEPAAGGPEQPQKISGNASFTQYEASPLTGAGATLGEGIRSERPLGGGETGDDFVPRLRPQGDTLSTAIDAPADDRLVARPPVADPPPENGSPGETPSRPEHPPAGNVTEVPVSIVDLFRGFTPPVTAELPARPGEALAEDLVNGLDPRLLMLDAPREVILRLERLEGAEGATPPAIGVFEIGFGGVLGKVRLVLAEDAGPQGEVSLGTLAPGTRLGLFTLEGLEAAELAALREGAGLVLRGPEGWPATTGDGAPPRLVRVLADGSELPVGGRLLLSTDPDPASPGLNPLNPDGLGHTVWGFDAATGEILVAFEQGAGAPGSPGRDFGEVLLRLHFGPAHAGQALHFPGDDGHLAIALPPGEGPVGAAVVELVGGYRPGDRLVLDGPADRDGDGLIDGTPIHVEWLGGTRFELHGEASSATYQELVNAIRFTSVADDIVPGVREVEVRLVDAAGHEGESRLIRFELREDTVLLPRHQHLFEGGEANDVVNGLFGPDHLRGGGGHDFLDGGAGDDRLDGGPGDDVLIGLTGADTLTGGPGADRFVVASLGDGHDIVTDFDEKEGDRLDLEGVLAGTAFDPRAPDASDWLRFEPADLDGDGRRDDVRVVVDLDGAGREHRPQVILSLHDLERPDALEIAGATTFGRGSDGGTG